MFQIGGYAIAVYPNVITSNNFIPKMNLEVFIYLHFYMITTFKYHHFLAVVYALLTALIRYKVRRLQHLIIYIVWHTHTHAGNVLSDGVVKLGRMTILGSNVHIRNQQESYVHVWQARLLIHKVTKRMA